MPTLFPISQFQCDKGKHLIFEEHEKLENDKDHWRHQKSYAEYLLHTGKELPKHYSNTLT
jgi:hypothetical protein